jgi:hypothetical protein
MPATVYGSAFFGVTAETALYTQSSNFEATIEEALVKDHNGDDVGGSYYNGGGTGTISGAQNGAASLTAAVAGTITVQNNFSLASRITGYSTGGKYIIQSISMPRSNTEFQITEISYNFKPWFPA